DGQKLGEAAAVGLAQDFDGIGAACGRGPLGVGTAGDSFAQSFSCAHAGLNAWAHESRVFAADAVDIGALGGDHVLGFMGALGARRFVLDRDTW
ncbi:MAG: hypothetical protein WCD43_02525, partial [Candidatus Acidiferrales bacterium]